MHYNAYVRQLCRFSLESGSPTKNGAKIILQAGKISSKASLCMMDGPLSISINYLGVVRKELFYLDLIVSPDCQTHFLPSFRLGHVWLTQHSSLRYVQQLCGSNWAAFRFYIEHELKPGFGF